MVGPYDPTKHYDSESGDELRDGDCVRMVSIYAEEPFTGVVASEGGIQYVVNDLDGLAIGLTDDWEATKTFDAVKDADGPSCDVGQAS